MTRVLNCPFILPPDPAPVGDGLAGRQRAAQLDVDRQRLGPDEARVERGRNREGIVDERAVEAVVTRVEFHVEAECIGDEPDNRVRCDGSRREHRILAAGEGERVIRRAAGPAGEGNDVLGRDLRSFRHVKAEGDRTADRWVGGPSGRPGAEDDLGRVGIDIDVPLGRGRRVAWRPVGAAHEHIAAEEPRQLGLAQDGDGEVGERTKGHEGQLAG